MITKEFIKAVLKDKKVVAYISSLFAEGKIKNADDYLFSIKLIVCQQFIKQTQGLEGAELEMATEKMVREIIL